MIQKCKSKSYCASFKLNVIAKAEEIGNRATAKTELC